MLFSLSSCSLSVFYYLLCTPSFSFALRFLFLSFYQLMLNKDASNAFCFSVLNTWFCQSLDAIGLSHFSYPSHGLCRQTRLNLHSSNLHRLVHLSRLPSSLFFFTTPLSSASITAHNNPPVTHGNKVPSFQPSPTPLTACNHGYFISLSNSFTTLSL